MSANETWLGQLSDLCICYTSLVSLLGFGVGYLRYRHAAEEGKTTKSHPGMGLVLPVWARSLVTTDRTLQRLWSGGITSASTSSGLGLKAAEMNSRTAATGQGTFESGVRHRKSSVNSEPSSDHPVYPTATTANPDMNASHALWTADPERPDWAATALAVDHLSQALLPSTFTCVLIAYCAHARQTQ